MYEATAYKIYAAIDEALQTFTEENGAEDGIAITIPDQWDGEFPVTVVAEIYDPETDDDAEAYKFQNSLVED